jgi:hypothetical protein
MNNRLLNAVFEDIGNQYGSSESPDFTFVQRRYSQRPYASLIDELTRHYKVTETTDLNDDVCVAVQLIGDDRPLLLLISLVGRYAVIAEITTEGRHQILGSPEGQSHRAVLDILNRHQVAIIPEEILWMTFPFHSSGQSEHSIYEVLFSTIPLALNGPSEN